MASDPKLRHLPDATGPAALFRVVDRQLRADPTLRQVNTVFRSWEGRPEDKTPFGQGGSSPWLRLTPRGGPLDPWASSTQTGTLYIDCDIVVPGHCLDDLLNFWSAVQRACYPSTPGGPQAFQSRLRTAGAHTGMLRFLAPVVTNDPPEDGQTDGRAGLSLDYRFDMNPAAPGF